MYKEFQSCNFMITEVSIDSPLVRWRIRVRCFNLQAGRSEEAHSATRWIGSRDHAVSRLTNTKAAPAGALGNGNGFHCLSPLPPNAFIPCDSISVSPFAPAKSNLLVVSWPARARHRNESRVDFHSFLNSRKWSRRFYPQRRKPLCPRLIFSASHPERELISVSLSGASSMIEFSGKAQKLPRTNRKPRARVPKFVNPALERHLKLKIFPWRYLNKPIIFLVEVSYNIKYGWCDYDESYLTAINKLHSRLTD